MRAASRPASGQASVELLAALPLFLLLAVAAAQLVAAGLCREYAAQAAREGAVALLQDRDPERAARAALPGWSRSSAQISTAGRRVVVRVRPPGAMPGLERLLTAESTADAGPAASAEHTRPAVTADTRPDA